MSAIIPFNDPPYFYSGDGKNPDVKNGVGFFYFCAGNGRIIVNLTAGMGHDVEVHSIFVGETTVIGDPMKYIERPTLETCHEEFMRLVALAESAAFTE